MGGRAWDGLAAVAVQRLPEGGSMKRKKGGRGRQSRGGCSVVEVWGCAKETGQLSSANESSGSILGPAMVGVARVGRNWPGAGCWETRTTTNALASQ